MYSLDLKLRLRSQEVELVDSIRRQARPDLEPSRKHRQTWCISEHKKTDWDPPGRHRKTWCIREHRNKIGPLQIRRGALVSTRTDLGPSRQTRCISEHRPDWDPPGRHRQTWCISEHRNRLGPLQIDVVR